MIIRSETFGNNPIGELTDAEIGQLNEALE